MAVLIDGFTKAYIVYINGSYRLPNGLATVWLYKIACIITL